MQSVSSRIWTRIAVFISYGDNDYTTGTSLTNAEKVGDTQHISRTLIGEGVLPICRDAVGVFYSPSRLGKI